MASHEDDLKLLNKAAREAGALAMSFFRRNPGSWAKEGGSPVTEADIAVDNFLRARLLAERPEYGWLSEETRDDPARRERDAILVVDPIDGTKAFIAGDDRWCISLAVVQGGRPVAAVLQVPARDELYTAARGSGAWGRSGQLAVSAPESTAGAALSGPRGWLRTPAVQGLGADLREHIPSLAYRFASVAAGRLDAAFASPRANDWDLAAVDLLLHEAGGRLAGLDAAAPRYNQETPRHGVLVAASQRILPALLAAVEEAERQVSRGRRI